MPARLGLPGTQQRPHGMRSGHVLGSAAGVLMRVLPDGVLRVI